MSVQERAGGSTFVSTWLTWWRQPPGQQLRSLLEEKLCECAAKALQYAHNPTTHHDRLVAEHTKADVYKELLDEDPGKGLAAKIREHIERKER